VVVSLGSRKASNYEVKVVEKGLMRTWADSSKKSRIQEYEEK